MHVSIKLHQINWALFDLKTRRCWCVKSWSDAFSFVIDAVKHVNTSRTRAGCRAELWTFKDAEWRRGDGVRASPQTWNCLQPPRSKERPLEDYCYNMSFKRVFVSAASRCFCRATDLKLNLLHSSFRLSEVNHIWFNVKHEWSQHEQSNLLWSKKSFCSKIWHAVILNDLFSS